jgi:hypothetical protein
MRVRPVLHTARPGGSHMMRRLPFIRRDVQPEPDGRQHLREGTEEDWYWGLSNRAGLEEDRFWRRLSDSWAQKDVLPSTYLELHNECYEAYNANPLANAVVEMGVNFVLGEGLTLSASHPRVQKLLTAFWNDPSNRMGERQYQLATELSLYGELFVRFFVGRHGRVTIRQIDPSLIDDIETDPEDIETELRVHRRATEIVVSGVEPTPEPVPGVWLQVPDDVVHFAVNKVSNAKRGKSDLATLLPWLRRYKDWLLDRVRINKYKGAFIWDVKATDADPATISRMMASYARPPEPGSVLVHNESEEWTAVQPRIAADDVEADGQAIKLMIAAGAGLPIHYLSDGGDVNRATAAEMGLPVWKRYRRRQDYLGHVLRTILDRVISEAQRAGALPRTIDTSYEIRFPSLLPDGDADTAAAAWHMAQALSIARSLDLVSRETALRVFLASAGEEIDAHDELARLAQESR